MQGTSLLDVMSKFWKFSLKFPLRTSACFKVRIFFLEKFRKRKCFKTSHWVPIPKKIDYQISGWLFHLPSWLLPCSLDEHRGRLEALVRHVCRDDVQRVEVPIRWNPQALGVRGAPLPTGKQIAAPHCPGGEWPVAPLCAWAAHTTPFNGPIWPLQWPDFRKSASEGSFLSNQGSFWANIGKQHRIPRHSSIVCWTPKRTPHLVSCSKYSFVKRSVKKHFSSRLMFLQGAI